jgi:cytochrome oxidase Cu insertion factor (SCO1/SenC/PrrC family)
MAKELKEAGRSKKFLMIFLVFGPALTLLLISTMKCEHKFEQLDNYGVIPKYEATTSEGKTISNETFKNKIVIYTTLHETCPKECGLSLWDVDQQLFRKIKDNPIKLKNVKIVSFVLDKDGNPVKDLSIMKRTLEYNVQEYDPSIWILAKGDAKSVYNIEHNGQNLAKQEGSQYFNGFAYNELILLADKKNNLRIAYKADSESMVRKIHQFLMLLIKQYDIDKAKHH